MIPVKLRLSGFTSYRDPVEIDFTGLDLACISGPNGAGKSSILDAITFALYGKARVQSEAIINTTCETAEVTFDFEYEGQVYRVIRSNTRKKPSQVDFFIQNPAPDEDSFPWVSLSEHGVRGTDEKIRNTLRLDYESFVNASFFLQGKADSFATKKPSERKEILTSILGLDQWEIYRKAANEKARQARNEVKIFERDIAVMQEEIENEEKWKADRHLLERELALAREKINAQQAQLDLIKAQAQLLANRDQQLQALKSQLERARQSLTRKQQQTQQQEATQAQYQQKISQSQRIESAYKQLGSLKDHLARQDQLAERFWPLERQRTQLENQLLTQKSLLENELRQLTREKQELDQALAKAESQKQRLRQLEGEIAKIDERLKSKPDFEALLQAAREQAQALEGENGALKNQMDEIVQRRQKLEDAQGASCPMCGQDLSPRHRQELLDEFNSNGKVLGDQYRLNRSELARIRQEIESLQNEQRQSQELEKQFLTLQRDQALLKQELSQLSQREEDWKSVKVNRFTQVQSELTEEKYLPEVRGQLGNLNEQLGKLQYDQDKHSHIRREVQENAAAEQAWQELQIARSNFELLAKELETSRQELERELKLVRELEEKYKADAATLVQEQAQIQDGRQVERELATLREEQDVFNRRLGEIDQSLAMIQTQRERQILLRKQMEQLNEEIRQYNKLEIAFGKDGVPAILIEQAFPEIEEQANQLLLRLSDYNMSVRFNTQRAYKDSKRKDLMETLDIIISDGSGTRDYETYSGGEAFRINFAIRVALSRVLARRAGARLQTLVIDEGFGNQDAQGRQRLMEAINIVKPDFEKILIITHIEELKDYFSNRIEVTKTPTGSQAEVILG